MGQFKIPSTMVKPKPVKKEKKSKVTGVQYIPQAFIEEKPYWEKEILKLGYTEQQAKAFASVSTLFMVELSDIVKLVVERIFERGGASATLFGLIAARIDQKDISRRMKSEKAGKKKTSKKPKGK